MPLPHPLISRVKSGRVALFLGAGALYGSTLGGGRSIPNGNDLRTLLSNQFLNGKFSEDNLAHVASLSISAFSLSEVQSFIAEYFQDIQPSQYHQLIPQFNWKALFTTNYDRLVEKTYQDTHNSCQNIVTIIADDQAVNYNGLSRDQLPYFKLHGCVTRAKDETLPLILTTDQYNEYSTNREGLFKHLYEVAYENTIVFIGHSLQDANIRSILLKLEKESPNGERHYLIKPGIEDIERDFWAEKKISALDLTFEQLLRQLSDSIAEHERRLPSLVKVDSHPIQRFFSTQEKPTPELVKHLDTALEVLYETMKVQAANPKDFFKGIEQGWSAVSEGIAIERSLKASLQERIITKPESDRNSPSDFFVIKGEAGSGKTILLRQLAWSTMKSNVGVCLWVNQTAKIDVDLLYELSKKSKERIFMFWDNAALNSLEINRILEQLERKSIPVTIVSAERYNEWNNRCKDLDEKVEDKFELRYLSESEINRLVISLEKNNSLGPNLINKTHAQRCTELKEIHGRQLLVALHEATMGERFEDIIFNEYLSIYPESAQSIYLTVCVLNRLRIPVRAGLISRIHDVTFDRFRQDFYEPLEKIVLTQESNGSDTDLFYSARHPEIAEIVFNRALNDASLRYNEYIQIINKLNIIFSSDRESFRQLIKAKSLIELFNDHDDISSIYRHAMDNFSNDPYLLQQMANYERLRTNGSIDRAIELLEEAAQLAPNDPSILHSLATCWRDKSNRIEGFQNRVKARNESKHYLEEIKLNWGSSSYVSSSFIELSINQFRDVLSNRDEHSQSVINGWIRRIQEEFSLNKKKYPSEAHLYRLEEDFSNLIKDDERAFRALVNAFNESDREPFLAIRLSSIYLDQEQKNKAIETLSSAIERRRAHHSLNFHLAEIFRNEQSHSDEELQYYYKRAFTPGDRNYQAQFWYARFCYFSKDSKVRQDSLDVFAHLRKGRFSFEQRHKLRDADGGLESSLIHSGTLICKRDVFGFVRLDGIGYEIFVSPKSILEDLWYAMKESDRVSFKIGFSFMGASAFDVEAI